MCTDGDYRLLVESYQHELNPHLVLGSFQGHRYPVGVYWAAYIGLKQDCH